MLCPLLSTRMIWWYHGTMKYLQQDPMHVWLLINLSKRTLIFIYLNIMTLSPHPQVALIFKEIYCIFLSCEWCDFWRSILWHNKSAIQWLFRQTNKFARDILHTNIMYLRLLLMHLNFFRENWDMRLWIAKWTFKKCQVYFVPHYMAIDWY